MSLLHSLYSTSVPTELNSSERTAPGRGAGEEWAIVTEFAPLQGDRVSHMVPWSNTLYLGQSLNPVCHVLQTDMN